MIGRSFVKLAFACLLAVCLLAVFYSSRPQDGAAQGASPDGGPGGTTVIVGNCQKTTGTVGGTPYRYCRYSKDLPYCTTDFSNCNTDSTNPNGFGVCAVSPIPPPPNDPRPCG